MSEHSYIDDPCKVALTSAWVAKDGCIFTMQPVRLRCLSGNVKLVPVGVAYNVGTEVAEHLVGLHNDVLTRRQ